MIQFLKKNFRLTLNNRSRYLFFLLTNLLNYVMNLDIFAFFFTKETSLLRDQINRYSE